jgi:hypothetical protein
MLELKNMLKFFNGIHALKRVSSSFGKEFGEADEGKEI